MSISNKLKLKDLLKLEPNEISKLDGETLLDLTEDLKAEQAALAAISSALSTGIEFKYGELQAQKRRQEQKDTGIIHLEDGEIDVSVDVAKTVIWDQTKLLAIIDEMDDESAKHYTKVSIDIPEAKYKAALPSLREKFDEARTVKPGKPKFVLKRKEK